MYHWSTLFASSQKLPWGLVWLWVELHAIQSLNCSCCCHEHKSLLLKLDNAYVLQLTILVLWSFVRNTTETRLAVVETSFLSIRCFWVFRFAESVLSWLVSRESVKFEIIWPVVLLPDTRLIECLQPVMGYSSRLAKLPHSCLIISWLSW